MKSRLISRLLFLTILFLIPVCILTSCRDDYSFFEAILRYGYQSKIPLGKKEIAIDQDLLGAYVYKGMPVIISSKDDVTYEVRFLSLELDEEDAIVEAFTTKVKENNYLNLDMGTRWSFLKFNKVIDNKLSVEMLRNTVAPYLDDKDLPKFLAKYGNESEYLAPDSLTVSIWYEFTFEKITNNRALEIQARVLEEKRQALFKSCTDYITYGELEKKYPGDPLLSGARESILKRCKTIPALEAFIARFPGDPLCLGAQKQIEEIRIFKADSSQFIQARDSRNIQTLLEYRKGCSTASYKDSALWEVSNIANEISLDDVEWKWSNGTHQDALQMIFDKIDYASVTLEMGWIQDHLSLYCLLIGDAVTSEKGLAYLDKLVTKKPEAQRLLDMYISKGFLQWSLGRNELAVDVFKSKINAVYGGNPQVGFREILQDRYRYYKAQGLVFPAEKKTWKKIKKL